MFSRSHYLRAERLTALAERIGKDAVPLALDISDVDAVAAAWEKLRRDHAFEAARAFGGGQSRPLKMEFGQ